MRLVWELLRALDRSETDICNYSRSLYRYATSSRRPVPGGGNFLFPKPDSSRLPRNLLVAHRAGSVGERPVAEVGEIEGLVSNSENPCKGCSVDELGNLS
jgi:hypothetical protein